MPGLPTPVLLLKGNAKEPYTGLHGSFLSQSILQNTLYMRTHSVAQAIDSTTKGIQMRMKLTFDSQFKVCEKRCLPPFFLEKHTHSHPVRS